MSRRCFSTAAAAPRSGRASWSLLLLVALLAAPIFTATINVVQGEEDDHAGHDDHDHGHDDHEEDEPPLEHLYEVYDKDGGHTLNATELKRLFNSLQEHTSGHAAAEAAAAEADAHAGHDHGPVAATPAAVAVTKTLTLEHVIEHYADNNANIPYPEGLNETAFEKACPAMLNCALEDSCEFEHDEEAAKAKDDDSGFKHVDLKLIFLAVIFVEGLVGGLLPLYMMRSLTKADAFMSLLNAFSGGIFLSTGLTHILPHVVESAAQVDHGEYPLPYALVMLGYMAIFMVERVLFHSHAHTLETEDEHDQVHEMHDHAHGGHGHGHGGHGHGHGGDKSMAPAQFEGEAKKTNPNAFANSLVLLVAISMHAILAGISLGIQSDRSKVITVMVAICSHKAPAAFSIGSKFMRNGMALAQVLTLVVIFSLVTPVGIGIGIAVGTSSPMAALIIEGLAAGTFIYVGATEISTDEFETTARACDQAHSEWVGKKKGSVGDEEGGGNDGGHTHRVHAPPGRVARMAAFSAYACGCLVILLTNLAPHAEH